MNFNNKNATTLFTFLPFINIILFKSFYTLEMAEIINKCTDSGAFYTVTVFCMISYLFYGFNLLNKCTSIQIMQKKIYAIGLLIMCIGNIPIALIRNNIFAQITELLLQIGIVFHVCFIYDYLEGFCQKKPLNAQILINN